MSASVEELGPSDADALRSHLAKDVAHNLYLLGILEEYGISAAAERAPMAFWGRFHKRELTGAIFVGGGGGLVVPSASDPAEIAAVAHALADRVHARACHGEAAAVEAIVRALFQQRPRVSIAQRLYRVSADDLGPFTNPTLRLAEEPDLPRVLPLAAGCVREALGRDPLSEDPEGFPARVLQRIRGRRTYVLEEKGQLVFKIDVGARSQYGAELEGAYTVPAQRGKGHATLSVGQISRHLLSSLPRLAMRVDDSNAAFAHVVRKVGYVACRPQRLAVAG